MMDPEVRIAPGAGAFAVLDESARHWAPLLLSMRWARVPARERENTNHPWPEGASAPLTNPWFWTKRIIVRSGYLVQPSDAPDEAIDAVITRQVRQWGPLATQCMEWLAGYTEHWQVDRTFPMLARQLRDAWLERVKNALRPMLADVELRATYRFDLRTQWYLEFAVPQQVSPRGTKGFIRKVGEHTPGGASGGYDCPPEYEPPGWASLAQHRLYDVSWFEADVNRFGGRELYDRITRMGSTLMAHPDDVYLTREEALHGHSH